MAREYIDDSHVDEYNSIKHGFRIRSGGFALAVGLEHEYGVSPPPEEMKLVGKSDFGTTFFRIESIGEGKGNRSLRSRRISLNWDIEKTILLLQLVSMSVTNITSALKIANGAQVGTCKFLRPQEDSHFDKPWSSSPGVTSCNMDFVVAEDQIRSVKKSELLDILNDANKANKGLQGTAGAIAPAPLSPSVMPKSNHMTTEANIEEKVILVRINRLYHDFMVPEELYEATRGVWRVGDRRSKADFAFAVYQGEIKEIYRIDSWLPAGTLSYETRRRSDVEVKGRWEFQGSVANNGIRNKYIGKSVKSYLPFGASNPIVYINY